MNLPKFSPEIQFIIYCSRINLDEATINKLKELSSSGLGWNFIINKAARHGVISFLYYHLQKIEEIWSVIPGEYKERIKQCYLSIAARNMKNQIRLKEIINLLNDAGVEAIVLKGAALIETVYKKLGLRSMVDVDLLVKREDLSKLKSLLKEEGYRKPDNLSQDSLEKFGGEIHLSKEGSLNLDVHSDLSQYERLRNIVKIDQGVWDSRGETHANDTDMRILDPTHFIMNLCLHHAAAHTFLGLFRFCDLRETILSYRDKIDWDDFVKKAKEYKIKTILYYSFFFSEKLFGEKIITDECLEALKPSKLRMGLANFILKREDILSLPEAESNSKKYIGQLFLMDSLLDMPRIVLRSLFPSAEWLIYSYDIINRRKLYYYRIFHPFIFIRRILAVQNPPFIKNQV